MTTTEIINDSEIQLDAPISETEAIDEEEEQKEVKIGLFQYLALNMFAIVSGLLTVVLLMWFYPTLMKFIHLDSLFGLTSTKIFGIENFWLLFFLPLYGIFVYYMHIITIAGASYLFHIYCNKKSAPVEGLFKRQFGKNDENYAKIKYYHYRGYIIKDPLWIASKSPFPWLGNWVLRFVGHNHISKNVVHMDSFPSLELTFAEDGVVYMPSSGTSSHVVDSIFGNLSIGRVIMKKNVIMHPNSITAPGAIIGENCNFMPSVMSPKDWHYKPNFRFYTTTPPKPMDHIYMGAEFELTADQQKEYQENGQILF